MSTPRKGTGRRGRPSKNVFVTKSGRSIKVNRSLDEKWRARKDEKLRKKAAYLSTLPTNRFKRMLVRMHPKRVIKFWFSRDGAIMALKVLGIGLILGFLLLISMFAYFRKDLPNIKDISSSNLGGSISYYDRTGTVLLFQDYNAIKRVPVPSSQISPYVKDATVAIEDKNFYHEGAFSATGIVRAGLHDTLGIGGSGGLQGASTITEQLVKLNENLTGSRTVTTKIKEIILAVELERQYSKDDVLTGYLNIAPYGGVDYGVESASEDYFGVHASQLSIAQAAMLAAIPQSPSYYSPFSDPQYNTAASENDFGEGALIGRQQYIIAQMAKQGYISSAQATTAEQVNVLAEIHPLQNKYAGIQDPYFVLAAKQQLENQYGAATVNRGGWKVITTLNTGLQNYAVNDINSNARNVKDVGGDEEAMVAEDVQTGQVVAQVGGENFNDPVDGQINYANTNISPGSSMKPFLYAALIQNNSNAGAGSILYDVQQPLPGYPCTNKTEPTATSNGGNCLWDDNFVYPGAETLRYALAGSRNVPAVKAAYEVEPHDTSPNYTTSINKWINTANSAIGVKGAYGCYNEGVDVETATAADQTQCYGSASLGSGDIALDQEVNGDVTLGRLGQEIPQTYILKITDASNKTVYQWQQPKDTQVYSPDTAYIIDSILDDPRASYLTTAQKFQNYDGWDIAVKTGTENQEFNGVMTAWSTKYAVIGFPGYHTLNKPLEEGHFEDITEPITRTWMEQALNSLGTKPVNWTAPSDIKTGASYVQRVTTGFGAEVPGPSTDLYPSWYTGSALGGSKNTSETLDKVSGDLATSCTPSSAKETTTAQSTNQFSVDIFWPLGNASANTTTTTLTDTVHQCSDSPPTITVTPNTTSSCDTVNGCSFNVTVQQGTHPLNDSQYPQFPGTITLLVNGTQAATTSIPEGDCTGSPVVCTVPISYTPTSSEAGQTISVTGQVTDSVLYQGTSNPVTVNVAATGSQ
jgi:membrane peptidoglycan carboxypeptidase